MSTNNAVNTGLSGTTGSGNFVGSTSPTLVTPTLGAATATSLTFNPTTGGVVGTTTNDNTGAGKVGEFISSVIASGSAVTITNGVNKDITSISLTAGDWDVYGNVTFVTLGTSPSQIFCWISSTSATTPNPSSYNGLLFNVTTVLGAQSGLNAPYQRFSLSGTTTIYLTAVSSATSGNATACGGIYARRAR